MFKSMFGFFNGKSSTPIFDDEIKVVFAYETLTQSELQMLQRIVAQHIRTHEQVRQDFKERAQTYPVGNEIRNEYFKYHREIKAHLKKLSALQYRLKHKIAAKG